jgi:FlaA1/EpsC-like NDP-sugar epimerase
VYFAAFIAYNLQFANLFTRTMLFTAVVSVIAGCLALKFLGVYKIESRYFGFSDLFRTLPLFGVLFGVSALASQVLDFPNAGAALSFVFLSALLGFLSLLSLRLARRLWWWRTLRKPKGGAIIPALLVGNSDQMESVLREMQRTAGPTYDVLAILDDNPDHHGSMIHGVPVLGPIELVPRIVEDRSIKAIVLAMSDASANEVKRVTQLAAKSQVRVLTVPAIDSSLLGGSRSKPIIREIQLGDLLGREPVHVDIDSIRDLIKGERVFITGAGGSIGSELARQISQLEPEVVILFGKGENSIFLIQQELLSRDYPNIVALVGDIKDRSRLTGVMEEYRPTVVFHAAAHKHVPLMEDCPGEAFLNNVIGTRTVATVAAEYGVKRFTLISTDKAVHPTSVMGATKRVAELVTQIVAQNSDTKFSIVRFGNVLGSRGSLVPTFKQQIERGGPLTVTHQDMTRYFMTIPEAVHLILQASKLGQKGETFILDMGEPVRIIDVAIDMIRMQGLIPYEDIDIKITGLRPGEKLYEELAYSHEVLEPTSHPQIQVAQTQVSPAHAEWLQSQIDALQAIAADSKPDEVRDRIFEFTKFNNESQTNGEHKAPLPT